MSQLQAPPRRPVVLCLDDDPATLGSLRRVLQKEPYEVVTTENPDEALTRLHRLPVDVVLVDERMPRLSGRAFLKMVEFWSPETTRLMVSGHPQTEDATLKDPELVQHFVAKPWNDDDLRNLLRGIVKGRGGATAAARVPQPTENFTTRPPAGPDFMAEQPVLVDCLGRSASHVMARLHPWLVRARAESRDVVAVFESLSSLQGSPAGLLEDLRDAVDVTGARLHLLDGSGIADEYFRSEDARHPRVVLPARPAHPRQILLVDPESPRRVFLKVLLSALGHRCRAAGSSAEARQVIAVGSMDRVLIELHGGEEESIALIRDLAGAGLGTKVIPLLGKPQAWSPQIAKKWNLQRPLVRPYRFPELADAVR